MLLQPIINIAEICAQKNVKEIILSPGSRCAPLTLAFVRHPKINTRIISDERSAAFIALGIAQQTRNPSALVSTSGTAALNYAPAVAEAFYQNIPLIIFTADRPPEWIGQHDGQTIHQKEIYGKNCKASYELPVDCAHPDAAWQIERIVSEAINISKTYPNGPVHINVPVREPFYPSENERFEYSANIKVIHRVELEQCLTDEAWDKLFKIFQASPKKLVVAGLQHPNQKLHQILDDFQKSTGIPVITDINSNLHGLQNAIQHTDLILATKNEKILKQLAPDLLISFGGPVISKSLKLFLRKYPSKVHWHIQPAGNVADTFKTLTDIINVTPEYFFSEISVRWKHLTTLAVKPWADQEQKAQNFLTTFFNNKPITEFEAVSHILKNLPENSILHLANSMPVRYASILGIDKEKKGIDIYSNRGTGGIDGCISTAVGAVLCTDKITTILSGDMAFFYDRNALWNNYIPENLRVIILNNHGGGIFGLIDGPDKLPELDEYFITKQPLNAKNTAKDHNLDYFCCDKREELVKHLTDFFDVSRKAKILEIETDIVIDRKVFNDFKAIIRKS